MTGAADFDRLIAAVKTRKEEAKLYRDDGDYEEAIEVLAEAIAMIDKSGWDEALEAGQEPTADQKTIAWHLADCLGMKGGNHRRLNEVELAMTCFQRGRRYEENARLGVNSSYNLVNEITLPIEQRAKTAVDQQGALQRAVGALERQVRGDRRVDRWAWADLGECRLLMGDAKGASEAYDRFVELGDLDSTRSAVTVLRRLAEALAEQDEGTARIVSQGAEELEERSSK
jgi:tetratricopeptide (TPR) repeat protein